MNKKEKNEYENGKQLFAIPIAMASGCLFGFAAAFGKIAASTSGLFTSPGGSQLISLLTSISFWGMTIAVIVGSISWILALREGRVAVVGPTQAGLMILTSVIIGVVHFDETLTLARLGGILIISLGGIILSRRGSTG